MPLTRQTLDFALSVVGAKIGEHLQLDAGGALGLSIDGTDVMIEWIESGGCAAVHTVMKIPRPLVGGELALLLMKAHIAGAGTHGCTFWMAPDETVRVGALLLGPACGGEELWEALERVLAVAKQAP